MINHQVWPVIHLSTPEIAYSNAAIASRCGCSGVFLIHMEGKDDQLDPVAIEIKRRHPDLLVGLNYLSLPAHIALARSLSLGMDATWTDKSGVRSDRVDSMTTNAIEPMLKENPGHLFFGSIAFKYQPEDLDPPKAALLALDLGMIPTTSGLATGSAPNPKKLSAIRQAIGDRPLALASGVTPDNAYELSGFLSHILVSTGISKSFHEFDEGELATLMGQVSPF